ncbi:hypothetical protein OJ998_23765 [Solirubrobacter taibaiensis]|nr:hypothetical protein [Solirubrobacter taibaiensis]
MRTLGAAISLTALLVVATPAAADYTRIAQVTPDDDVAIGGGSVVVGATPTDGTSALTLHGLDGSVRPIAFPRPSRFVEEIQASASAMATITQAVGGGDGDYYGPLGGPLRRLPRTTIDIAVTGDTVVTLQRRARDRGRLELRNVRTGKRRRIEFKGERPAIVTAAGRYAAFAVNFATGDETIVVVDLRTGRERYRVRKPNSTYGLAPDGRLWFVRGDDDPGRIMTATRSRPRPRTVARTTAYQFEYAVGPRELAVARPTAAGRSEIVLVRPNGTVRVVTPPIPSVSALAYDGTTLAFGTGTCVFAGPPPAGTPGPMTLDGCEGT